MSPQRFSNHVARVADYLTLMGVGLLARQAVTMAGVVDVVVVISQRFAHGVEVVGGGLVKSRHLPL